jgi:ArsR family metal-binding transcriptional regulator
MSLLRDYEIRCEVLKCSPQAETAGCLVDLGQDITEVLPYLNAVLERCRYSPNAPALEISYQGRGITLWPRRVVFGGVTGSEEAQQVMRSLQQLINDTWARRDDITPSERRGPCLSPLALFKLLPGLNCGECGQASCLAFAAKLARQHAQVEQCVPLSGTDQAEGRSNLVTLLVEAGYDVPEDWR